METDRVTDLLDTDVLVDCLRGTPEAQTWLNSRPAETFLIPGVVAMELVSGCRDRSALRQMRRFLDSFTVAWPEAVEFAQAFELLSRYRLAHGLGIPDCLIASMALNRSMRLLTFNAKHFRVIPGLHLQEPYTR